MRADAPALARPGVAVPFLISVALISGAVIAFQIAVMRVFSIANWAHFGSLVISIAMFGFGVVSAIMVIGKGWFERHWDACVAASLIAFGPLMALANTLAQTQTFNPILMISNPEEQERLFANFVLYFLPFVPGALFLGLVFLKGKASFGKVYFANMTGSGLGGLTILMSMYLVAPDSLLLVPLVLWFAGALVWFATARSRWPAIGLVAAGVVAVGIVASFQQINVSPFKGVSYARNFPDAERVYDAFGPLGRLEVYESSYFHFAPGLSDVAAFNLPSMPENAYLGMYMDSDGPIGIMKALEEGDSAYFRFLPMHQPFLLKDEPEVFVVQFGGGISTRVALAAGAQSVTVAEGNPMVLEAIGESEALRERTGNLLDDPRITVVPYDGRLYAPGVHDRFDVIDFSLADGTGLSSPGGFSIYEKYAYTRESMEAYMRALAPDGVLSVTLWNKEDPPKSVLRLFATLIAAAEAVAAEDGGDITNRFFVNHTYLSTVTVLFKRDGFTADEVAALNEHSRRMSFDVLYAPGTDFDTGDAEPVFQGIRDAYFDPQAAMADMDTGADLSATNIYRIALAAMMAGDGDGFAQSYLFRVPALTNDQPYFAAYLKTGDIPGFLGILESVSDEWGYLLLWATLAQSLIFGVILLLLPVVFGWRTVFAPQPGKVGILVYFMGLGLGYIVVEVGMISKFMLALTNPVVSASVLITGMLVFSGIGSLVSGRYLDISRRFLPKIFLGIAALLVLYMVILDPILEQIGLMAYPVRVLLCLLLIFPPAFLMGFPFATGMAWLARLEKEHFFLWAWGINGSFSVVGSVLVPLVAVHYGLDWVLGVAALAYLMALPAFFALLKPRPAAA
ncbi:MAG: hypothetical protein H6842_04835 [Rhodospirillaceae bacterium]|nr:hypothetical protein [Rhodospirillaceae bacterium]